MSDTETVVSLICRESRKGGNVELREALEGGCQGLEEVRRDRSEVQTSRLKMFWASNAQHRDYS